MKPETAQQILAAGLHDELGVDHDWSPGCCGLSEPDFAQSQRLVEFLERNAWHVAHDLALPESAPKGDPKTAAESIDDLSGRQWSIWRTPAQRGPMAPEEIHAALVLGYRDPQSEASVRSRLVELERAGHVRRVKDEKRKTSNGGWAQVWAAVGELSEALAS